ncbi:Uncharacterized protein T05H10.4 [Toxocara canis]|uniref:Uncharacterized protein T05H10.4 n=2 Tax=Toxocara canis TaxID=6265 RepID=A0A0B2V319_TOXCA|nr:Uncharacterized protein T05H10.4 [Toxocara canis]
MDGSEEVVLSNTAQPLPAITKPLDITEILRENPDVLNMIASFPFLGAKQESICDETDMASNSKSTSEVTISYNTTRNDEWFLCFEGPCVLATALTASLNVIAKGISGQYEYYECLNRLRFKCSYRVRIKRFGENFICEEFGVHRHKADTQLPLSSTGLPRTMREIVDESFRENWTYMERQEKLTKEANKLGLEMGPKMNRQIDNRLSYLRRTRNIRQMQQIEHKLSSANDETECSQQSQLSSLNGGNEKRGSGTPD